MGAPIIYGLVDPLEPTRIRYVGQTTKVPLARYVGHLGDGTGVRRVRWIAELRAAGRAPDMVLLDTLKNPRALDKREMQWIADMKACGMADLNAPLPQWFAKGDAALLAKRQRINHFCRTGER